MKGEKRTRETHLKTIYLSRHGESLHNLFGKIGGDSELSSRGWMYAKSLPAFFKGRTLSEVWTSDFQRTKQTAEYLDCFKTVVKGINEIKAGDHDSLTYEEIAAQYPEEFALRDKDKLRYRYPNGESYMDVVGRLKPLIKNLYTKENIFIVSHQATLRCVLALLLGTEFETLPYTRVPLHTVIELRIDGQMVTEVVSHKLNIDCVDTHRVKPENCEINRNMLDACLTVPKHL